MARRAKGEGTVRKRKDGRWEATFTAGTDDNGKPMRKSVLAKTRNECLDKLAKAKEKIEFEKTMLETKKYLVDADPTLEEWFKVWMDTFCYGVIKDYTANDYRTKFEYYILPRIGDMHLSEISNVVCQQLFTDLLKNGRIKKNESKGKGLSAVTVQDVRRIMGICLEKAVDEELITKNPTRKITIPNDKKVEMQTLKKEEIGVFLEEAKRCGMYEFFLLELTTGLRQGEIISLTWDDFDAENKTISVNKTASKVDGKTIITTPKTAKSNRTVKLTDECTELLKAMELRKMDESNLIFPSPKTGEIREGTAVTRQLHRIQQRAGLPRIRFHDLRHTFATLMLEQGVDVKTVSQMLGHTDAGFTMNTYMHVTADMQQNAVDAMSDLIKDNAKPRGKIIKIGA